MTAKPTNPLLGSGPETPPPLSAYSRYWIERLRKPVSFGIGVALAGVAGLTKSINFEDAFHVTVKVLGYFFIIMATIGRIWCAAHITGRKNRELCRTGPYSYCRNPLYFFSFLGALGVGMGAQACPVVLIMLVVFLLYYRWVIQVEERRLGILFGADYAAYCASVPRFWPRWHKLNKSELILPVDVRALSKAVWESSLFLLAILLIEVIETLKSSHPEWFWHIPW